MLLALDIGNTEVTVGLFLGKELRGHWRMTTTAERTPAEWAVALEAFLVRAGHSLHRHQDPRFPHQTCHARPERGVSGSA